MLITQLPEDIFIQIGKFLGFNDSKLAVENLRCKKFAISDKIYGGKDSIVVEPCTLFRLQKIYTHNPKLLSLVAHCTGIKKRKYGKVFEKICRFKNLQRLCVNTRIINLGKIDNLHNLTSLTLYGLIRASELQIICDLPKLQNLQFWEISEYVRDIDFKTSRIKSLALRDGYGSGILGGDCNNLLSCFTNVIQLSINEIYKKYVSSSVQVLTLIFTIYRRIDCDLSNVRYLNISETINCGVPDLDNLQNLVNLEYLCIHMRTISAICGNGVSLKFKNLKHIHIHFLYLDLLHPELLVKLLEYNLDFEELKFSVLYFGDKNVDSNPNWIILSNLGYTYKIDQSYSFDHYLSVNRGITPNQWLSKNGYHTELEYIYNL